MASITCTNCGATLKSQTAIPAGKKIKCPKCGKPFVVEAEEEEPEEEETDAEDEGGDEEEEETPKSKKPAKASDDEDESEEEDEDEKPKKKGKGGKEPKKSSAMLFGIIGGVLVLCCCCTVVPGGGWFFRDKLGFGEPTKVVTKDTDKKDVDKKDNAKTDSGKDGKPPLALKADFKLKPEEIAADFSKNVESASKKYTDKVIEFTGEVKEVSFFGGERKLGVAVAGGFIDGMDYLLNVPIQPADHAKVYRLSKGQQVKIVAPYNGAFGRMIGFEVGTLTEVSKSTIIEVTSETLSKDYLTDQFAADNKYRDKTLLVTGAVVDSQKDKDGQQFVKLKSANKLEVRMPGNALGSLEVDKLRMGQTGVVRVDHVFFDAAKNEIRLSQIVVAESK